MNEDSKLRSQLHAGHRMRLRNRARKEGLKNFNEHQVLELLLSFVIARKDTNDLAHVLINKFGSLNNVINTPYEVLVKSNGLGDASASFLTMLPEFISYLNDIVFIPCKKIENTVQTVAYLKQKYKAIGFEKFIALFLAKDDTLLYTYSCDDKDKNQVLVDTNKFSDLLGKYGAKKIIISHNHPNGNCFPSKKDIEFTRKLYMRLCILGVDLVDHCILGLDGTHYSMRTGGDIAKVSDFYSKTMLAIQKELDSEIFK